jgi:hypothetical protein
MKHNHNLVGKYNLYLNKSSINYMTLSGNFFDISNNKYRLSRRIEMIIRNLAMEKCFLEKIESSLIEVKTRRLCMCQEMLAFRP